MPKQEFQDELRHLINRHSIENGSNAPDFMLAEYLVGCLDLWNATVTRREDWYGRATQSDPCPSNCDADAPEPSFLEKWSGGIDLM
jgi:hypothetical protein